MALLPELNSQDKSHHEGDRQWQYVCELWAFLTFQCKAVGNLKEGQKAEEQKILKQMVMFRNTSP